MSWSWKRSTDTSISYTSTDSLMRSMTSRSYQPAVCHDQQLQSNQAQIEADSDWCNSHTSRTLAARSVLKCCELSRLTLLLCSVRHRGASSLT